MLDEQKIANSRYLTSYAVSLLTYTKYQNKAQIKSPYSILREGTTLVMIVAAF